MKSNTRWALILVAGLLLLILPSGLRMVRDRGAAPAPAASEGQYTPPAIATPALAATPVPTATPRRLEGSAALPAEPLRRGPVVVDLAHYTLIERARFQPLAAALAPYGLDLRFWLPTVDTSEIEQITDFPDQSAALDRQLAGASALAVISPFFLYTPAEVAVVERFVADGGRLLLISDPDVESDSASDTNQLAAAFNVIFNQDYLYDTVENDANFTYFFQGEFRDAARSLAGSHIAFYGGRSIGGAVEPQVRSAATTLSSLRDGLTSFNTVVLGGAAATGSAGRVLAMSDFDVLTDPYVARHDNRRMLAFVAGFLAGAERDNGLADFPNFLGKEVSLSIDSTQPVGALALGKAAELQRVLEASGRTLALASAEDASSGADSGAGSATGAGDLIYVAGYRAQAGQPELLAGLDIRLVEEVVTPTVNAGAAAPTIGTTPAAPPAEALPGEGEQPGDKGTPVAPVAPPEVPPLAPTAAPAGEGTPAPQGTPIPQETPDPTVEGTPSLTPQAGAGGFAARLVQVVMPVDTPETPTGVPTDAATGEVDPDVGDTDTDAAVATLTPAATPTVTPTVAPTATPTATPTPQIRLLLQRSDGLRLLADETLLYVRQAKDGKGDSAGGQMLAVLGNSEQAISAALTRLINRDFAGCLVQSDLVICPYSPGSSAGAPAASAGGATPTATATGTPGGAPAPATPAAPAQNAAGILIVDDNAGAAADEPSEAAIYLTTLTTAGYTPDLWVISEQGTPEGSDLIPYAWVVWSDAGYDVSGIDGENLRVIGEYINQGGRLTISSRMPFFGVGARSPSAIRDIQVTDEIPELVRGLPTAPIALTSATPLLSPLEKNPDPETDARSALVRGPVSGDQGAPVLILMSDAAFEDPKGARLLLFGLSMGWLPPEISDRLIRNMAGVMLAE